MKNRWMSSGRHTFCVGCLHGDSSFLAYHFWRPRVGLVVIGTGPRIHSASATARRTQRVASERRFN
jgi:hypothetical protein